MESRLQGNLYPRPGYLYFQKVSWGSRDKPGAPYHGYAPKVYCVPAVLRMIDTKKESLRYCLLRDSTI